MKKLLHAALIACAMGAVASAQPVVTGALNTASYAVPGLPGSGLAQGAFIAIFGRNIGPAGIVQASSFPLPSAIGGTSARLTGGGRTTDLIMVYSLATQVGAIIPSNTPTGTAQLTVTFNGQTSAPITVNIVQSQFGAFSINQAGSGPVVAQIVRSESDRPVATILDSARPGQTMILWGTGLGPITGNDAAGAAPGDLNFPVEVYVGGRRANVIYKGRSGCCAGIDQIVFDVPGGISGCALPVVVIIGQTVSNNTTLAVSPNGGACSDPFSVGGAALANAAANGLRVGSVSLSRTDISISAMGQNITSTTEVGAAVFAAYTPVQITATSGVGSPISLGSCNVYTYSGETAQFTDPIQPRFLDAGPNIAITGPNGAKTIAKIADGTYSSVLSTSTSIPGLPGLPGGIPGLPGGGAAYISPGAYTSSGSGGTDVGAFRANLNVTGNFNWTNNAQIVTVPRGNDLTITWTGGGPTDYVMINGSSYDSGLRVGASFTCIERAPASRFTVPSFVMLSMPGSTVVQGIPTGNLSVGLLGEPVPFTAPGIDVGTFSYSSLTGKNVTFQ